MTDVLRPSDVARRWQVKESYIRRLINEERLPAFRVGKLMRVHMSALLEYEQEATNEPLPARREGFVYFIASPNNVKIGYATDPEARMRDMQVANAEPLKILGTVPGTMQDERVHHALFAEDRIRGEWFTKSDRLLRHIESTCRAWQE